MITAIKEDLRILGTPPTCALPSSDPAPGAAGAGEGGPGYPVFLPPLSPPGGHCAEVPPHLMHLRGSHSLWGLYTCQYAPPVPHLSDILEKPSTLFLERFAFFPSNFPCSRTHSLLLPLET